MRFPILKVLACSCAAGAICCAVRLPAQSPPLPLEAAAAHTHADVVRALYWQILERDGGDAGVQAWTPYLAAGYTPRQLVHYFADSQEYRDRFITPYDSRTAVTLLYRHVLAREPDAEGRDWWASVAEANGWGLVIQLLVWSEEYRLMFGDHGVPGRPVTVWDRRAALMLEPRTANSITERDLCLTVAAGGGAYECGDLRLAHALPAVRALGRTHAPVLLYNSEYTGERFPLLAARIMPGEWSGVLERVELVLWLQSGSGWVERGRRAWQGAELSAWTPGQARRVALRLPHAGPTGVYNYRVEAIFWAGGNVWGTDQLGQVAVVNRMDSPFGRGWWVAGLEKLIPLGNHLYWVGGDGSTKMYQPIGGVPGTWVGAAVDRPDTIVAATPATTAIYPNAAYERKLPAGARIVFSADGLHIATVNRLDRHTRFVHVSGRLQKIQVPYQPGPNGGRLEYVFHYTAAGRLDYVTAPDHNNQPARTLTVLGDPVDPGRVGGFVDPDGSQVAFEYEAPARISARVDRRRTRTVFGYDPAGKLSLAHVQMRGTGEDIVTRITPAESRGLLAATDTIGQPLPVHDAFTLVNGPRDDAADVVDHTRLWLDRWGGPWLVQNALGLTSSLKRGDWRFPALVTESRAPNNLVTRATYNARGNPASVTVVNPLGDGVNDTTRYEYTDSIWTDFVTRIVPPMGDETVIGYDPVTGNRLWQQDARGPSTRVVFGYYGADDPARSGLLKTVTTPATPDHGPATETYAYDGRGNLEQTTGPLGEVTIYRNDALGRTVRVVAPRFAHMSNPQDSAYQETAYDAMDRVAWTRSVGPKMGLPEDGLESPRLLGSERPNAPEEQVVVQNFYNAAGQLDSVARWAIPDTATRIGVIKTRWRYDAAGRVVAEIAEIRIDTLGYETVCPDPSDLLSCYRQPTGFLEIEVKDSTRYDPAGNAVAVITRRGHTITAEFDALNRLRRRTTPPVGYPAATTPAGDATWVYPHFAQAPDGTFPRERNVGSGGVMIPGDVAEFEYDSAGRIKRADNADAQIRREYYPNGLLRSETQRLRTYTGADFGTHAYTLSYEYDRNGRRRAVVHPAQLAPAGGTGRTAYTYAPHGALETVRDVMNGLFTYHWNADGSLASRAGTSEQRFTYDLGGQLIRRVEAFGAYHDETYTYDQRGKTLAVTLVPQRQRVQNRYTGLGALTWSYTHDELNSLKTAEEYATDPFANYRRRMQKSLPTTTVQTGRAEDGEAYGYQPGTGRLVARAGGAETTGTSYDAAGNQQLTETKRLLQTRYEAHQGELQLYVQTRSYYDAEQRLRVLDRKACLVIPDGGCYMDGEMPPVSERSSFEEYRYDALGRRVLTRARQEFICHEEGGAPLPDCVRSVVRTVWDGDQILYEVSAPGGSGAGPWAMEADVGHQVRYDEFYHGYGRVAYAHGLGIDDPLSVTRVEYSDVIPWPVRIVPSSNWAGRYDGGTGGECVDIGTGTRIRDVVWEPGVDNDGRPTSPEDPGPSRHCVQIDWPALGMWMNLDRKPNEYMRKSWMGSLLVHGRDPSGQYYRRNRFYDASTGRFTQEDPIGLAGGLNLYGFGNGDPIAYSDPYGLCPPKDKNVADCEATPLGDAWRALDAAGSPGRATIGAIVDKNAGVVMEQDISSACPTSQRGCVTGLGSASPVIHLNGNDPAGALAVTLGHEGGGHLTQEKIASTVKEQTAFEVRAWRLGIRVYDRLSPTRKAEADATFVDVNGNNQIQFFKSNPSAARRQIYQNFRRECIAQGHAKC